MIRHFGTWILVLIPLLGWAQSPHGETFEMRCDACHATSGWDIEPEQSPFDHEITGFALTGQHEQIDCRMCHEELVFVQTSTECRSCHIDMHQEFLGTDCARCHTTNSWIVDNITEIHEQISFPLLGAHATPNCFECHLAETDLRFEPIGVDCINCHGDEYDATSQPDHRAAGFSTDCSECHNITAFEWSATGINHDFFPLTLGHDIADCAACHTTGDFADASPDCISCHEQDFESAEQPDHVAGGFSTSCVECHTTNPGWMPADYREHDVLFFPIYSGEHGGEWSACIDCHTTGDLSEFSCIDCHEHNKPDMDDEHAGVTGYSYASQACFACHPNGSEDGSLDHSFFPLTLGHALNECTDCHQADDFSNISPECVDCHQGDFDGSINPPHVQLGLTVDCASCHTADPDWDPARFDIHDEYYVLNGAHAIIADQCVVCHNGDYVNTPNTCVGCHQSDYDATIDPDHEVLGFPTDCISCHSESEWVPATYDHDAEHFPIYSGNHAGVWTSCSECHSNPNDYNQVSCTNCHTFDESEDQHEGIQGYVYNDVACLACHPTGSAEDMFDHDLTGFSLTGAHAMADCLECHANGFDNTPNQCVDCHTADFEGTSNPDHSGIGLNTDCASCHSTGPGWAPASFDIHDDFFVLNGAHAVIRNDCAQCHEGDYIDTPTDCIGCHSDDYSMTVDPDHEVLQFSTNCTECHTESAWVPATFDHDAGFPIYSGEHAGVWTQCAECHNVPGDYGVFTCTTCHGPQETAEQHEDVGGYVYNSEACFACHPMGSAEDMFDHATTGFALTGAHTMTDCIECHTAGFEGTPSDCAACHEADFNASLNPDHGQLGLPMNCVSCHTTAPDWQPASFDIHDTYYALTGAHAAISQMCAECHNGDYVNTPETCYGCHQADYEATQDPSHVAAQFGTDCMACHNETAWEPSTFDHDGEHFPINSGEHAGEWTQCIDCHTNVQDYGQVTCTTCHIENETAEQHDDVGGYIYQTVACLACHPDGNADQGIDHNETAFPLTGAHLIVDCAQCHTSGFEGTPTNCSECHDSDFNSTSNPNHTALGFTMDCAQCHTTEPEWNPAQMPEHDSYYPLNGAHAAIASNCAVCHNGDYVNTPSTCIGCHQEDYDQTVDPPHVALQFDTDCIVCHSENEWDGAMVDHDGPHFPIYSGSHAGTWDQCSQCHSNANDYTDVSCSTCHSAGVTDGQHVGVPGYIFNNAACLACHPTGESVGAFDHAQTGFALTGAHASTDCFSCHDSDFSPITSECASCHQADYDQANNPNHSALGIDNNCVQCHTTAPGWAPALFEIHNDFFALDGAHATIADNCVLCHEGDYNNTPSTCVGCHESNYNSTTNPDHLAIGISNDCAACHTTDPEWNPATFEIHDDYYPLNGAHAAIATNCVVCHSGDFNNTPNTCFGCHQAEYEATSNPNHAQAQFPTDCIQCHTESVWIPSTFDHDNMYFPIYSGRHEGEWVTCSDCHNVPTDYTIFDCLSCHVNPETDEIHEDVPGYIYNSISCFECHPQGED